MVVTLSIEEPALSHSPHSPLSPVPELVSSNTSLSYWHNEDELRIIEDDKTPIRKRNKRVRFSVYSTLTYIPSLDNFSQQEKEAMFQTKDDCERIRDDIDQTLTKIANGDLPDTESEYFRGLEMDGINVLRNQKKAMRQQTVSLILIEQDQRDEICPQWIEHIYCRITKDSVSKAAKMAEWDAQNALDSRKPKSYQSAHILLATLLNSQ